MRSLFALIIATVFCLAGVVATAAEVPTYELMGFAITPHQFAVVGSANVQEQSPTPSLVVGGMPASPHQVAVLTPRLKETRPVADQLTSAESSNMPPR
jgi:hypothetical protein